MLDRIDKAIISVLLKYKGKYLTINQLASKAKIAPLTARRHLLKLKEAGYVNDKFEGKERRYDIKNG